MVVGSHGEVGSFVGIFFWKKVVYIFEKLCALFGHNGCDDVLPAAASLVVLRCALLWRGTLDRFSFPRWVVNAGKEGRKSGRRMGHVVPG